MIRIANIKLRVTETEDKLIEKAAKLLRIKPAEITAFRILKRSLDAREKPYLYYVYTVAFECLKGIDKKILGRHKNVTLAEETAYAFPPVGREKLTGPVVVIGSGPAGLFAAFALAQNGYRPLILERGDDALTRREKTEAFWNGASLDLQSNAQFGEGGAGTFSDGKLNTSVKDPSGRRDYILRTFVGSGAPQEILYDQKPHLGTDALIPILIDMRRRIEEAGGTYLFRHQVTDLVIEGGRLAGVVCNGDKTIPCGAAVLAIGHSARDTYLMLQRKQIAMVSKAFAAGIRIEHPQEMIDLDQYGRAREDILPPAAYKLTHQTPNGRGVYSFCMCPGGYVVNASSEPEHLCVNGMSYQARDSANANTALIVTVDSADYEPYADAIYSGPLSGIAFQRELEKRAYQAAGGAIPCQLYEDFLRGRASKHYGDILPCHKGMTALSRVDDKLPPFMTASLKEGIASFGRVLRGFDRPDALISGIEARTSSPVRIVRDSRGLCSLDALYPCGEGAGYAGGIISAAMDGLKSAEYVMGRFAPR